MELKFIQQDKSLQLKASKNLFKKLANSVIESAGIKVDLQNALQVSIYGLLY